MNFFSTPLRRKILFGCLYLSEGAPIGFLWLALPTQLRARGVPVEQITGLTAMLVLPWTFKFLWAPVVDMLRGRRWTLRHWIVAAQSVMGVTLASLLWLDPVAEFQLLAAVLLVHAFAAATQDVSIDALCITATVPAERGQYNGWMQAGMLLGRAMMGGGGLVLAARFGDQIVLLLLLLLTTFSALLVIMSRPPDRPVADFGQERLGQLNQEIRAALRDQRTWLGLAFAGLGGAAFKSLEVYYGPLLIDRGFESQTIGWFSLGPMIGSMLSGALLGGWLADRVGHRRCVAGSLCFIALSVGVLAVIDLSTAPVGGRSMLLCLAGTAFGIGVFTASSYALFMDLTRPAIGATQFSAFMGATNGCESWSTYVSGRLIAAEGYYAAMLSMSLISLLTLPLLAKLRPNSKADSSR